MDVKTLGNIFSNIPKDIPQEIFEEIMTGRNCKIERIISKGHATPEGQWYDQDKNEWVILLKGNAVLLFEGNDIPFKLQPGDYINITAHMKHRVEWTDQTEETIWLAINYK
jgi:cupin 2 domain-containing protein